MNWDALGAAGEIIGALAVLATLLYLASQIRITNEISRFTTAKDIFYKFDSLNDRLIADPELSTALLTTEPLTEEQEDKLYSWATCWANSWLICQTAYNNGLIDDSFFKTAKQDVFVEINRWRNFRPFLIRFLDNYPEFCDHEIFGDIVEQMVAKRSDN